MRRRQRKTGTATRLPGGSGTAAAAAEAAELIEFEVGGLAAGLRGERSFLGVVAEAVVKVLAAGF
jgi:hypothetical protein